MAAIPAPPDDAKEFHKVKRVSFFGRKVPIVMQNENGPCPLLGIANALLLRNALALGGAADRPEVSTSELMSLIAARLLDANARSESDLAAPSALDATDAATREATRQNREQNVADAMAVLPALATGLDVNVRFRHALDFEFTAELAIFDLLDVTLCHAWVVDPDDAPTAEAVAGRSYNQLVERIVALDSPADAKASAKASENKGSDEEERRSPPSEKTPSPRRNSSEEELLRRAVEASLNVDGDEPVGDLSSDPPRSPPPRNFSPSPSTEKLLLSDFLERSASQLTPYGLANARASVKERELVVFFRNNHFATVFKLNGALYLLVTDQGYLGEPDVVWEVLAEPEVPSEPSAGGPVPVAPAVPVGSFVTGDFAPFAPHADPAAAARSARTEEEAQMAAALLASAAEARGGAGGRVPDPGGRAGANPSANDGSGGSEATLLPNDFLRAIPSGARRDVPDAKPSTPSDAAAAPTRHLHHQSSADADYALAMQLQAEFEEEERRDEERRARARREAAEREAAEREREATRRPAGRRAAGPGAATTGAAERNRRRHANRRPSSSSDCAVM